VSADPKCPPIPIPTLPERIIFWCLLLDVRQVGPSLPLPYVLNSRVFHTPLFTAGFLVGVLYHYWEPPKLHEVPCLDLFQQLPG